jgi:aminoglycoside phosphotransferase (APT) family kinase protein
VDTEQVVTELNVALGTNYELTGRLTGGLQGGAYELTTGTTRVVLKWSNDPSWAPRVYRAARLVEKARAVGYPTPAWLAVGTSSDGSPYQLQEFVEGTQPTDASTIDQALATQLVEICETQHGLVDDAEANWSNYVHGIVFEGWDGMWETVRQYDETSAELIAGYEQLCRPYREVELPTTDLVHGDLNVGNLLVHNNRITGIVDIEAAGGGTRAYDLVALATSAARDNAPPGIDEFFYEAALKAAGHAATAVCAASAYASITAFVHTISPASLPLTHRGGARLLDLLRDS